MVVKGYVLTFSASRSDAQRHGVLGLALARGGAGLAVHVQQARVARELTRGAQVHTLRWNRKETLSTYTSIETRVKLFWLDLRIDDEMVVFFY